METQYSKEDLDRSEYHKKVLTVVPQIHPYVKHRLYIAESIGVLPKNMYNSNGVIDDCIIKIYENGYNCDADLQDIKLKLFQTIDDFLEDLFVKEAYHKKTISTNRFLQEEMKRLEESFTIDADLDYMMLEQLDDISYHQHDNHHDIFVFDENNTQIMEDLDLSHNTHQNNRKMVGKFYNWLPLRVANIVDLYTFGKLNYKEIATIKHIEFSRVEKILKEVKKQFRSHLE